LWEICKKEYGKVIQFFPKVLVAMLKRYSTNDGKEEKNLSPIKLSHLVDLREHSSDVKGASSTTIKSKEDAEVENECSLIVLRAVVAHHGSSLHVGHYKTVIYINEDVMLTLDESCIQQTSMAETARLSPDAYIMVYERAGVIDCRSPQEQFCNTAYYFIKSSKCQDVQTF